MDFFLADDTSLRVLRGARSLPEFEISGDAEWRPRASRSAPRGRDLPALWASLPAQAAAQLSPLPARLAYFSRESRPSSRRIQPYTLLSELPDDSFVELSASAMTEACGEPGAHVYLESPGLAFVRMAQRLSQAVSRELLTRTAATVRLAGFGMELCGSYARDPQDPAHGECAYGLAPLCRAADLAAFCEAASGIKGLKLARASAALVRDGSGSPAETLLALAMGASARLGGAELPDFAQNAPLDLDGYGPELVHHHTMRPDFHWPRHRVAIEYNGHVHDSESGFTEDHLRRQDYATLGISLLEARSTDIRNVWDLERFLRLVARKLEPAEGPGFVSRVESALTRPEAHAARAALLSQLAPPSEPSMAKG